MSGGPDQDSKGRQASPRHLGDLVRWLRETAGWTRRDLSEQTGLGPLTLRNLELGRGRASGATWRRILAHPAMARLPELAAEFDVAMPAGVVRPGSGPVDGSEPDR